MITIDYRAVGFAPSWGVRLAGGGQLGVRFIDLVAAAATVGRRGWAAVLRYGVYSRAEILYRVFQVVANLAPVGGRLTRSVAYDGLDPSEKSAISYFIGLVVAKLIADDLFSVPFLVHIGNYSGLSFRFAPGASRPDLVGMDARSRWYVVEAKGRSHGAEGGLLSKAKAQTRRVRQVAGQFPCLRVAVVTEFRGDVLQVQLADPEDHQPESPDWEISALETLQLYYAPWLEIISAFPHAEGVVGERRYAVVPITELDMAAGVELECARYLRLMAEGEPATAPGAAEDLLKHLPQEVTHLEELHLPDFETTAARVGRDGLLLALGRSWSEPGG